MSLNADIEDSEDSMYVKNRKSVSFKLQTKVNTDSAILTQQELLLNPMSTKVQPMS
jgi:hypothetical protein